MISRISVTGLCGTSPLPRPTTQCDGTLWVVGRGSGLVRRAQPTRQAGYPLLDHDLTAFDPTISVKETHGAARQTHLTSVVDPKSIALDPGHLQTEKLGTLLDLPMPAGKIAFI